MILEDNLQLEIFGKSYELSHPCMLECLGKELKTKAASNGLVGRKPPQEALSYMNGFRKQPTKGKLAPFSCVKDQPPVETLDDDYPLRLTTGRALDSYNTGVQTDEYSSPIRSGEAEISTNDAKTWGINWRKSSWFHRRGSIEMTVKIDPDLPIGLAFTVLFP